MGAMWQHAEQFTIAAAGTATFTVPRNCPLDRLTIWAVSGNRVLASMNFQTQINGKNYNPVVTITAAEALDVIYRSGGASSENDLIPFVPANQRTQLDPFDITVLITNNDEADASVTMFAVGIQHQG